MATVPAMALLHRATLTPTKPEALRSWLPSQPVAVDGFTLVSEAGATAVLRNDGFELRVARRPEPGDAPPLGLVASIVGLPEPVVLVEVVNS